MLNEIYDDYYQENGQIEFDVTKLKKMKVAELRELCYLHNVDSTGVKAILITKLESFAAGNYVHLQKPEPIPEMPLDEIILKMQQEMELGDMSVSEKEGGYYLGGFIGKNDPKLAKKADQIKDGEAFVVSKWINLRNFGGLAIPAEKFAEDLVQMNIVFKVKESTDFDSTGLSLFSSTLVFWRKNLVQLALVFLCRNTYKRYFVTNIVLVTKKTFEIRG